MKKMTLIPYESIGSIRFGTTRETIRKILPNYQEFKKNRFSRNTTDDYGNFHIFYDDKNKVEAVEIFKNVEILVNGKVITSLSLTELSAVLNDSLEVSEKDSVNFPTSGLSISIQGDEIESYFCYQRGYWD